MPPILTGPRRHILPKASPDQAGDGDAETAPDAAGSRHFKEIPQMSWTGIIATFLCSFLVGAGLASALWLVTHAGH
jgi:hypothetical protein